MLTKCPVPTRRKFSSVVDKLKAAQQSKIAEKITFAEMGYEPYIVIVLQTLKESLKISFTLWKNQNILYLSISENST